MAKKTSASATPKGRSKVTSAGDISPEQRERVIQEAAYFRYLQRGAVPGHDLDDWLAAEAALFWEEAGQKRPEQVETTELEVQESGAHGAWKDDELKRIVKQHPRTGIPQVESMEAQEAPPKE